MALVIKLETSNAVPDLLLDVITISWLTVRPNLQRSYWSK